MYTVYSWAHRRGKAATEDHRSVRVHERGLLHTERASVSLSDASYAYAECLTAYREWEEPIARSLAAHPQLGGSHHRTIGATTRVSNDVHPPPCEIRRTCTPCILQGGLAHEYVSRGRQPRSLTACSGRPTPSGPTARSWCHPRPCVSHHTHTHAAPPPSL